MNVSTTVPPCVPIAVRVTDAWHSEKERTGICKNWVNCFNLKFCSNCMKIYVLVYLVILMCREKLRCVHLAHSLIPLYIKNILKIPGTDRDVFNLELGMKKAGIVRDTHLILTTCKASALLFRTVRWSLIQHILTATFIAIPW